MTELERIAANVAKALGLDSMSRRGMPGSWIDRTGSDVLLRDGSNLFDPVWQVRCRDWLHRKGLFVTTWYGGGSVQDEDERRLFEASELSEDGNAEFCARAIHGLIGSENAV